jgi:hypothetical protein
MQAGETTADINARAQATAEDDLGYAIR